MDSKNRKRKNLNVRCSAENGAIQETQATITGVNCFRKADLSKGFIQIKSPEKFCMSFVTQLSLSLLCQKNMVNNKVVDKILFEVVRLIFFDRFLLLLDHMYTACFRCIMLKLSDQRN